MTLTGIVVACYGLYLFAGKPSNTAQETICLFFWMVLLNNGMPYTSRTALEIFYCDWPFWAIMGLVFSADLMVHGYSLFYVFAGLSVPLFFSLSVSFLPKLGSPYGDWLGGKHIQPENRLSLIFYLATLTASSNWIESNLEMPS